MGEKQDKSKSSEMDSPGIQVLHNKITRGFKKLTADNEYRAPGDQGSYNRQESNTSGAPQPGRFNTSFNFPGKQLFKGNATTTQGPNDLFVGDEKEGEGAAKKVGNWLLRRKDNLVAAKDGVVAIGGGTLTMINPLTATDKGAKFFGMEKVGWKQRQRALGDGAKIAFKKCTPAAKDIFQMYMVVQTGGVGAAVGKGLGKRVLVNIFETPFMDSLKSQALASADPTTQARALSIMNIVTNCTSDPAQLAGVLSGSSTDGFGQIANMTSDQKSSVFAVVLGGEVDVLALMNASDQGLLNNVSLDNIGAIKRGWEQQRGAKDFIGYMTEYSGSVSAGLQALQEESIVAMRPKYRSPQSWHNNLERVVKWDTGQIAKWKGGQTGNRRDPKNYESTTRAATFGKRFTKVQDFTHNIENGITVAKFEESVKSRLDSTFTSDEKTYLVETISAAFAEYTTENPYVRLTLPTLSDPTRTVYERVVDNINGYKKLFDLHTDAGYDKVYEYSLKWAKQFHDPRKFSQPQIQNFGESQSTEFANYDDLDECTSIEECEHCETDDFLGRYYFIPDLKSMVESGVAEPICINPFPGAGDSDDAEWVQLEGGLEHEGHLEDLYLLPPTEPTNPNSETSGIQDADEDEEFQSWRHLILEIWEKGDKENLLVDMDFAEVVPQGCINKVIYNPSVRWRQGCEDVYVSFYCYDTELGTPHDDDLLREYSDIGDYPFPDGVDVDNLKFKIRAPNHHEELGESEEL